MGVVEDYIGVVKDSIMAGSALKRLMQEYKGWREMYTYTGL